MKEAKQSNNSNQIKMKRKRKEQKKYKTKKFYKDISLNYSENLYLRLFGVFASFFFIIIK